MNKSDRKMEVRIWIGILVITFMLFLAYIIISKNGNYVQVRVNGKIVAVHSLNKNGIYPIVDKGKNVLVIKDGEAYIKEADCPDKLCVKQGKVRKVGQSLICLQNKVVVEVVSKKSDDKSAVDAVAK